MPVRYWREVQGQMRSPRKALQLVAAVVVAWEGVEGVVSKAEGCTSDTDVSDGVSSVFISRLATSPLFFCSLLSIRFILSSSNFLSLSSFAFLKCHKLGIGFFSTRLSSRVSSVTIGVPIFSASTYLFQGSPPTMDMTSFRIFEDGLSSMSTTLTFPSSGIISR